MEYLKGEGPYFSDHPSIVLANQAILDSFVPQHPFAFFTICSWGKPYSRSYVHNRIREGLFDANLLDKVDYIHMSSAGIVPFDCELWYPFFSYDWNNDCIDDEVTFKLLRDRLSARLTEFIERMGYAEMFFYIRPSSNTSAAVKVARKRLGEPTAKRMHYVFPSHIEADYEPSKRVANELARFRSFVGRPDPDDILTLPSLLSEATQKMKGVITNG